MPCHATGVDDSLALNMLTWRMQPCRLRSLWDSICGSARAHSCHLCKAHHQNCNLDTENPSGIIVLSPKPTSLGSSSIIANCNELGLASWYDILCFSFVLLVRWTTKLLRNVETCTNFGEASESGTYTHVNAETTQI